MGMHNFRELKIWQRSMNFVVRLYNATADFPKEERYGLTVQLRKSGISAPSNISEGAGRSTDKQFRHFLEISMGSINEVQTQIELADRLNYLVGEDYDFLSDEALQIYKMILSFYNTLKSE